MKAAPVFGLLLLAFVPRPSFAAEPPDTAAVSAVPVSAAPESGAPVSAVPVSALAVSALTVSTGAWTGTNHLWVRNPNKPFTSSATLTVAGADLTYTWSYNGEPQTGVMHLVQEGAEVTAVWTDTWHSPTPMTFKGSTTERRIVLLGSYSLPGGPAWGWRIELLPTADTLTMRMYNITPKGKEQMAVELVGARAG